MSCEKFRNTEYCKCNRNRIITIFEKGHPQIKYVLKNERENELCVVKIDGGFIKDEQLMKCDFLALNCNTFTLYFIEMKGSDFMQAVKQIKRTIEILLPEIDAKIVNARIVLSKVSVPQYENNPEYLKLKKIIKKYNGTILQKTRLLEEVVN
jgi:hypothetical protein